MTSTRLDLVAQHPHHSTPLTFAADRLVCCGWVGRDRAALQAHIDELARLGVSPPGRVPIYMNFSTYLLTTSDEITVISEQSSGEVEYVLLCEGNDVWVTVGSDHTDRDIETKSIAASKQMYAKIAARECWRYADVREHWNRLTLRCWVTANGSRALYQEAALDAILAPDELFARMPERPSPTERIAIFSGTIPTRGGLVYGQAYEVELEDPVRSRSIRAAYRVKVLPQHL